VHTCMFFLGLVAQMGKAPCACQWLCAGRLDILGLMPHPVRNTVMRGLARGLMAQHARYEAALQLACKNGLLSSLQRRAALQVRGGAAVPA
jgi:hypothetical protein